MSDAVAQAEYEFPRSQQRVKMLPPPHSLPGQATLLPPREASINFLEFDDSAHVSGPGVKSPRPQSRPSQSSLSSPYVQPLDAVTNINAVSSSPVLNSGERNDEASPVSSSHQNQPPTPPSPPASLATSSTTGTSVRHTKSPPPFVTKTPDPRDLARPCQSSRLHPPSLPPPLDSVHVFDTCPLPPSHVAFRNQAAGLPYAIRFPSQLLVSKGVYHAPSLPFHTLLPSHNYASEGIYQVYALEIPTHLPSQQCPRQEIYHAPKKVSGLSLGSKDNVGISSLASNIPGSAHYAQNGIHEDYTHESQPKEGLTRLPPAVLASDPDLSCQCAVSHRQPNPRKSPLVVMLPYPLSVSADDPTSMIDTQLSAPPPTPFSRNVDGICYPTQSQPPPPPRNDARMPHLPVPLPPPPPPPSRSDTKLSPITVSFSPPPPPPFRIDRGISPQFPSFRALPPPPPPPSTLYPVGYPPPPSLTPYPIGYSPPPSSTSYPVSHPPPYPSSPPLTYCVNLPPPPPPSGSNGGTPLPPPPPLSSNPYLIGYPTLPPPPPTNLVHLHPPPSSPPPPPPPPPPRLRLHLKIAGSKFLCRTRQEVRP
jgi:hypothetical protein